MAKIKLMCDSNCDIPLSAAKELGIQIIPFVMTIDGREYLETVSFSPAEYYELLKAAKELPATSQITPMTFMEHFEQAEKEGYDAVICTTLASLGSGTFHNAMVTKDWFFEQHPDSGMEIHVLDSKNYSISYGYGVIRGAKAAQAGCSVEQVLSVMNEWFDHLETYFTVFTLKYVHKSGRISSASQILGEALGFRPVMSNLNGAFNLVERVRGNQAAIEAVARLFEKRRAEDTDYVVLRGESDIEAKALASLTTKIAGKPPVDIFYAGATLSTNTGPKTTGIGFMAKSE